MFPIITHISNPYEYLRAIDYRHKKLHFIRTGG